MKTILVCLFLTTMLSAQVINPSSGANYPGVNSDGANGINVSGSVTAGTTVVRKITFQDSFAYADGALAGRTAPTGQTWVTTGNNPSYAVVSGNALASSKLDNPLAWYAYINTGSQIYSYSQTFTISANGGADGSCDIPTQAIVGDPSNMLNKMIHATFTCIGTSVTWWNGASQSNQPAYKSSVSGKWVTGMTMTAGSTYTLTLTWDGGNWVYVTGPDGGILSFYDTNFAALGGTAFFNEQSWAATYQDYTVVNNITVTTTAGVSAGAITASTVDGMVGSKYRAPGYFSQVGIGIQQPSALLHILNDGSTALASGMTIEGVNQYAIINLNADTAGYVAKLLFNSTGTPSMISSSANGHELRFTVNTLDALNILAGGSVQILNNVSFCGYSDGGSTQTWCISANPTFTRPNVSQIQVGSGQWIRSDTSGYLDLKNNYGGGNYINVRAANFIPASPSQSSSGTIVLDLSTGGMQTVTPTGAITFGTPINYVNGQTVLLNVCQGSTPYSVGFNAYWRGYGAFPVVASTCTLQAFVASGGFLYAAGSATDQTGKVYDTTAVLVNSSQMPLAGTTGSIGGSVLTAGQCASGTASVTSSTTSMSVSASPVTYPGDGYTWSGYVSAAGTATVKLCAIVAGTPPASAYNVRVIQ